MAVNFRDRLDAAIVDWSIILDTGYLIEVDRVLNKNEISIGKLVLGILKLVGTWLDESVSEEVSKPCMAVIPKRSYKSVEMSPYGDHLLFRYEKEQTVRVFSISPARLHTLLVLEERKKDEEES